MQYSFTKGLRKGVVSALTLFVGIVALTGFSDVQLTVLLENYLFPVLGSMTVGGALTMLLNYVKVKRQ